MVKTSVRWQDGKLYLTILGQPYSKANSRQLTWVSGKPRIVKSKDALAYVAAVKAQVPVQRCLMEGDIVVYAKLFYATQRPDLDPSALWDALEKRVYQNDRQLREMHLYHAIDKTNPRAEIVLEQMQNKLC